MTKTPLTGKPVQKNKIAARVRNMNIIFLFIILVLIAVIASVTVTGVTGSASENLARFYSMEAVNKFTVSVSPDLTLVRKVANSRAVIAWFTDETNDEKRLAAYNEMMDYANLLHSAELYFGIDRSLHEFSIGSGAAFKDFVPGSVLRKHHVNGQVNITDIWYFDCVDSDTDYVLNIDIDKFSHRWRLWINHKVISNGKIAGVFCSGIDINKVLGDMFEGYDSNNVKGYIIDRQGFIQMTNTDFYFNAEGSGKKVQEASGDPAFALAIESYLDGIEGFFGPSIQPEVIQLSKGPYGYVSIASIPYTDWSVVTFFNNNSLFSVSNLFPLFFGMLLAFLLYTAASYFLMHRLVILPLNRLTRSLLHIHLENGAVFGCDRTDEIGELALTIQNMRDSLNANNINLFNISTELEQRDTMLQTVNQVATILLESEIDRFAGDLRRCMGMLGAAVDVDRVYIWKNYIKDGKLCCTQLSEWSEGAEPQQGSEYTVNVAYDEIIPHWETRLSRVSCINNIVRNMSAEEQSQLSPQGVLSILIMPVYLQDNFWGFVGFDDCDRERIFTANEESILRSASLLIATALLRNEMTLNLHTALEKAQAASNAKTSFLSNMSHEIRTPMNAIIGMTAIGKSAPDLGKKNYAFDKIEGASTHLLGIINDILEMSKIEAGKFELSPSEFNLEKLVQKAVNVISLKVDEKKQNFTVHLDKNIPQLLYGDDQRLTQVITNLLSNAVKFTPECGSIHLTADLENEDNGICTIKIAVSDTGIGISAEQQSRLFSLFEQAENSISRKFGGTGLGLAISKRIIEMMNGSIRIESELN
jgi:signal transduction histidine kinase/HAMP domain-containing protein